MFILQSTATQTIGGMSDVFNVTTESEDDTTPYAFSFNDQTFDGQAFADITITDLDTNTVLFSKHFTSVGDFTTPGSTTDSFILPYDTSLQVEMAAREFSRAVLYFGETDIGRA